MPFAALECVEGEVYLVDGEIGDPAGVEDDDLISVISAAAGRRPTYSALGATTSLRVVVGQHVMPLPRHQALSAVLRRSVFSSSSSCS